MRLRPEGRICSFCGTVGTRKTRFAGGFGAMICVSCIERYAELLSSATTTRRIERPPWEGMSREELLETLPLIARSADQVQDFLVMWVDVLRQRKVSWADIGQALGISRQAAWERFARALRESVDAG